MYIVDAHEFLFLKNKIINLLSPWTSLNVVGVVGDRGWVSLYCSEIFNHDSSLSISLQQTKALSIKIALTTARRDLVLVGMQVKVIHDLLFENAWGLHKHFAERLHVFQHNHLVIHPRVFSTLLRAFLLLVAGFIEVRLTD
jgi:hypothetical protein